jgi:homoaconitase/3-isopropylmalate dehydratase large subunit
MHRSSWQFGGIAGVCEPDAIALDYIHSRVAPHHRDESILFRPDAGATYSATYTIDLAEVSSLIAL